jgi:hypothetical protein
MNECASIAKEKNLPETECRITEAVAPLTWDLMEKVSKEMED